MNTMKDTVLAFLDRINAHDVDGIIGLMADDYTFVNSSGDRFQGRQFMRDTWEAQFKQHPDFRIRVQRVIADNDGVGVFGWAEGTYSPAGKLDADNHWEVPSAFWGIARNGKMVYWQTFSDASIVFDVMKTVESATGE